MNTMSRTEVRVIKQHGETLLVQYTLDGVLERKYIPVVELGDGRVLDEVLEQGILFGYPFDELEIVFDNQKFANELHQVGIWKVDDMLKNPKALWSALHATLADDISLVLETALHERKRSNHNGK